MKKSRFPTALPPRIDTIHVSFMLEEKNHENQTK